jgi:hypothetical protein
VLARPTAIPKVTVGELSASCTRNRADAQQGCEEWRRLGVELATAAEAERLDADLAELRTRLETVPATDDPQDPQTAALSRLGLWFQRSVAPEDIQLALSALLALVVETGSGFGLYLVSGLRQRRGGEEEQVPSRLAERLGTVADYMLARLEPAQGESLSAQTLYGDYAQWCHDQWLVALTLPPFLAEFTTLAAELGIRSEGHSGATIFYDVRLGGVRCGADT